MPFTENIKCIWSTENHQFHRFLKLIYWIFVFYFPFLVLDIFDVPLLKVYEKATVNIYMMLESIKLIKLFMDKYFYNDRSDTHTRTHAHTHTHTEDTDLCQLVLKANQ